MARKLKRQGFGPGVKRGQKRDEFGRFHAATEFPPRPPPLRWKHTVERDGVIHRKGEFMTRVRTEVFGRKDPLVGLPDDLREIIGLGHNGSIGKKSYVALASQLGYTEKQAYTLWFSP